MGYGTIARGGKVIVDDNGAKKEYSADHIIGYCQEKTKMFQRN